MESGERIKDGRTPFGCRVDRREPSTIDCLAKRARYIVPLRQKIVGAELNRAAGGADEVAEDGDVGAVDTDAAGIDRQAELFGLFEIDTRVVQFGKAETLRGQNAIEARRIDGTGRTMPFPRTPRYLVELLPVAFVPGLHTVLLGCARVEALTFPFAAFATAATSISRCTSIT